MNKTTLAVIGIAAASVVGYMLWKKGQNPAAAPQPTLDQTLEAARARVVSQVTALQAAGLPVPDALMAQIHGSN